MNRHHRRLLTALVHICVFSFIIFCPDRGDTQSVTPENSTSELPHAGEVLGCVINPSESVSIASSVDGLIARISVDQGDRVTAGQVLTEIRADVEAASVELARVRANDETSVLAAALRRELAHDRLERAEKLFKRAVEARKNLDELRKEFEISDMELKKVRVTKEIAALELKRSEALLALHTLTSPFDGLVVERQKAVGEYAEEGEEILTLAKLDPLHVEAFISLEYWGKVENGQKVKVIPRGLGGAPLEATVVNVVQILDAASGTFGIRLAIPNPDSAIPAGLWCDLAFDGKDGSHQQ